MMKRRNFSDRFKATVALEALCGDKTIQEIAAKRQLHPTQVTTWKRQAQEGLAGMFSDKAKKSESKDREITYIPVKHGFLYLVAIMDWATRKVLSWRLSNTLDA